MLPTIPDGYRPTLTVPPAQVAHANTKRQPEVQKVLAEENSSEDQDTATAQPGIHMNVLNMFTALVAILLR